jgi:hypothetical protein
MVEFFAATIYIDGPARQKLCAGSRRNYVNWPGAGLPSGQKGVVEVTGMLSVPSDSQHDVAALGSRQSQGQTKLAPRPWGNCKKMSVHQVLPQNTTGCYI